MKPADVLWAPVPAVLFLLTFTSGMVDAVSFLNLNHVFVANMTGNVVFLGFALAGAPGLSAAASLAALGAFLAGSLAGGRFGAKHVQNARLLAVALGLKIVLFGCAALCAGLAGINGTTMYALIGLLAFSMGLQNAAARKVGVADLTTTVVTQTLSGLAADSSWAGGSNPRAGRRLASVASMFLGALTGAGIVLHVRPGAAVALGLACVLFAAGVAVLYRDARRGAVE